MRYYGEEALSVMMEKGTFQIKTYLQENPPCSKYH